MPRSMVVSGSFHLHVGQRGSEKRSRCGDRAGQSGQHSTGANCSRPTNPPQPRAPLLNILLLSMPHAHVPLAK